MTKNTYDGWIVIDKPLGMTSTQVLGRVRKFLNTKKVGHLGTLDPLASGVLPIALGEGTKTIPYITNHTKKYGFTVLFGIETDTGDLESIDKESLSLEKPSFTEKDILNILPQFIGTIQQIPPAYSAIKIDGQPAYKRIRKGEEVVMPARHVDIYDLQFKGWESDTEAAFEVTCSQGTYVRTLGQDIAKAMGTKGTLSKLRRLASGCFNLSHSNLLENLEKVSHNGLESQTDVVKIDLISCSEVLADIPALSILKEETSFVRQGKSLQKDSDAPRVRLLCEDELIAVADVADGIIKPKRVFNCN